MSYSLRTGAFRNTKTRFINLTTALVLAVTSVAGIAPLLAGQNANALSPSLSSEWVSGGGYGSITQDGDHFVTNESGTGPFTRFGAYRSTWPGTFTTSVDVYLDPTWSLGSGFDYSVAANGTNGAHRRDFVFQVAKDTSTGELLVGAANGSSFSVNENLENNDDHYAVATAGWYTLQHTFNKNEAGVLSVTLSLLSGESELFSTTLSDSSDLVPSIVGGNRYGWFTFVNVAGGLSVSDASLVAESAARIGDTYYDTLQAAVNAAEAGDTVTLLEDIDLSGSYLDVSTAGITIDGDDHELTTNNMWQSGYAGNGTTDYVVQVNADDVTIQNLDITGHGTYNPAGGINIFDHYGVVLQNLTVTRTVTAVAVVGSEVLIDGLTSTNNQWGHAVNVDKGSAPNAGELTVVGTNSWNSPRFIYVDNIDNGSVYDEDDQYKQVLVPSFSNPAVTAAIYVAPQTEVTTTLSGVTNGSATTPADLTLGSPAAYVQIPAGTVISGDSWNGTLSAPDFTTGSFSISGYTVSDVAAIKVGVDGLRLTFSQPVSVQLPGQQGKKAGYIDHNGVFHMITVECANNPAETLINGVEECWTQGSGDLVIWTTHFTTFVSYSATAIPTSNTSSGSSSNTTTSATTGTARTTATASVVRTITNAGSAVAASAAETTASVLGTAADTSSAATDKAATTTTPKTSEDASKNFLSLGWWWILVLAAVGLVAAYFAAARRSDNA